MPKLKNVLFPGDRVQIKGKGLQYMDKEGARHPFPEGTSGVVKTLTRKFPKGIYYTVLFDEPVGERINLSAKDLVRVG
jgi:hypothetical protein